MFSKVKEKEYKILLIEDNKDDILLTQLGLKKAEIKNTLEILNNGKAGIDYLLGILESKGVLPDLILMDINLPLMNGFEVLEQIKSNQDLCELPIVIFTSSDSQGDMRQAYEAGADLFIRKPNNLSGFRRAMLQSVQLVKEYVV